MSEKLHLENQILAGPGPMCYISNNRLGKVGKRSKLIDIENALKLANADGLVTFDEVRQNLKK